MKKVSIFLAVTIAGLLSLWFFKADVLTAYAKLFTVDDATKGADAIVMLGGDPHLRAAKAVGLLKEGYAPQLLLTDPKESCEKYQDIFPTQLAQMRAVLAKESVQAEVVPSLKSGATSTFDEAYDLASYSKKHGFKRIIIVTGGPHTMRARYAFEKVFALQGLQNVKIECAAAKSLECDETNWWRSEYGLGQYLLEPLKFAVYLTRSQNLTCILEE